MTCSVSQVGDREWWCATHRRDAEDCDQSPTSVPSTERHSPPTSAAIRVTKGDRYLLHALAHNVAAGKPHAKRQADELIPVLARVPRAYALFEELVEAVSSGNEREASYLLDLLTAEAA